MANPQYARPQYQPTGNSAADYPPMAKKDTFEMPKLGATFVPSGFDDYYMPEVIAPEPQRVMPEVPKNMQNDLQRMELEARQPIDRHNEHPQAPAPTHERERSLTYYLSASSTSSKPTGSGSGSSEAASPAAIEHQYQNSPAAEAARLATADFKPLAQAKQPDMPPTFAIPSFSPFPHINQDHVPPSDDDRERILYDARQQVLRSNDVDSQLEWALDVLIWVETAQDAAKRESGQGGGGGARPQTPRIEHELRTDAKKIVEYLAGQSHPQALFARSKWLEFGKFGYRLDKNEAFLGYMNAANRGWSRAEFRIGMIYENANDIKNALEHYNLGLSMKDSASTYRLGMMHLLGQHGHTKDYRVGLEMLQSAADTADDESPQAAYVFGMIIARELPDIAIPEGMLPVNLGLARQYIEKAAFFGFAKAQLKMGQAYELCQLGCDFNPALSLHYYGLAARQGQAEAALGVSRWFLFGYDGVFGKNEQLAFQYAREAADAKLATGEFAMGYYHEIGIFVQKDLREARVWYERAADHGNKDAQGRLEGLSQAKTLTKQDHETTALTRIKSKHGSMRAQRPERFSVKSNRQNPAAQPLASLSEATPTIPVIEETVATPAAADRPPVFAINIDNSLAMRPKSTAPYPDDNQKPAPLNPRPKSAAPYPDGDPGLPRPQSVQIPQLQPQQKAARPMSAFGIRPNLPANLAPVNLAPAPGGGNGNRLSVSQSTNTLMPDTRPRPFSIVGTARPLSNDPRGRAASVGYDQQAGRGRAPGGPGPGPGPAGRGYDYGYPPQQQQQQQRPQPQQQQPRPQQQQQQQPPQQYQQQLQQNPNRMSGPLPPQQQQQQKQQHPQQLQQNPNCVSYPPQGPPQGNRLSKSNPNSPGPAPGGYGQLAPGAAPPSAQAQPGRDYGPRTSSRLDALPSQGGQRFHSPSSSGGGSSGLNGSGPNGPNGSGPGPNGPNGSPGFKSNGQPGPGYNNAPRPVSGTPQAGFNGRPASSGTPQGTGFNRPASSGTPQSGFNRPASSGTPQSGINARPGSNPPQPGPASRPAAQPSKAKPAKPAKTAPQGPATFEEMGIPQGKSDDDCVIM